MLIAMRHHRGFLQHRQAQLADFSGTPGNAWLFFGCRRAEEDFLYRQDFEGFRADGTLAQLHVAFSRAQVWTFVPLLH